METYSNRKYTISLMFILIGLAFLFRLAYMQLIDSHWVERAAQISERKVVLIQQEELYLTEITKN